jgi:hypothetical protein
VKYFASEFNKLSGFLNMMFACSLGILGFVCFWNLKSNQNEKNKWDFQIFTTTCELVAKRKRGPLQKKKKRQEYANDKKRTN